MFLNIKKRENEMEIIRIRYSYVEWGYQIKLNQE